MYSFLVDNTEHLKAKGVNRNIVTLSHDEYEDALLNNKYLRHSMNRIQILDYRIGAYEMCKTTLSCFDGKIYIQKNGQDGLALGYYC